MNEVQSTTIQDGATWDAVVAILEDYERNHRVRNDGHFAIPAWPLAMAVWETLYPGQDNSKRSPEQHAAWENTTRAALTYLGYSTEAQKLNDRWYYLKPAGEETSADTEADIAGEIEVQSGVASGETPDAEVAFQHRGARAAVFKPHFGQAHQQYFSPRWVATAFAEVAETLFGIKRQENGAPDSRLNVLDPTCGSGRLLAPFAGRGHLVLGIELDERLVPVARRAVGRDNVRQGDICAYGAVMPEQSFQVAVINPPYGLWWPVDDDSYLAGYELRSAGSIESQNMVLELVTNILQYDGLLLALLSGRFFEVYPQALDYLKRNYQVIANLTLPRPYKAEYGIDVDATLVVACKVSTYTEKYPAPLSGDWDGEDAAALTEAIVAAFADVQKARRSRYYSYYSTGLINRNYRDQLPPVPHLDMAVQVDTTTPVVRLTRRGLRQQRDNPDWATAWLRFYQALPLQDYSAAEGTMTDVINACGSLANVLMAGTEVSRQRLEALGFQVEITPHDAEQIARAARHYERQRIPIRELEPMEYLAYYADGPITAQASVIVPGAAGGLDYRIVAGQSYDLRARWKRVDTVVKSEAREGNGKGKSYMLHTHVDRGYMVFHFTDAKGNSFTIEEANADQVKAMIDAFGLPEVRIVDDLPDFPRWKAEVNKAIERQAARNGGHRPTPNQALDIIRFCTKSRVANLWQMGSGKTMAMAFWATVRGYKRVVFITVPSIVPGIIEDLEKWGFPWTQLTHTEVSHLKAQKQAYSAFFQRIRQARQRVNNARAKGYVPDADMCLVRLEGRRLATEQALARKRRHLRNLRDIKAKNKATGDIDAEIAAAEAEIAALETGLDRLPKPPEKPTITRFYIASYTDVSLGDNVGIFDEWECQHYDRDGNLVSTTTNTGARCSECGRARKQVVTSCPRCGARGNDWRGEGDGGARVCRKCGYRAWTLGASQYHDAEGKRIATHHQYPLAPRARRLFSAVLVDEAQEAKSKLSLRGAAVRGLRGNGQAILTGTWIKGYVPDLFWTAGWLLGFGSPAWPFPYRGGSARFLEQFGTFEYTTKEFADSLQVGKRRLIPSVSNLNRLWRLLGPVAIHRPMEHFNDNLPPKHVQVHWVKAGGLHGQLVDEVEGAAQDVLRAELRKPQEKINMGVVSMALWWSRYVASCPTPGGCAHYAGAYGHHVNVDKASISEIKAVQDALLLKGKVLTGEAAFSFNKVRKALELIREIQAAGEKVLVFTSLRGLLKLMEQALDRAGIPWMTVDGVDTGRRNTRVREFEAGNAVVLLAGTNTLNRGVSVPGANHVIILNVEWSPEITLQAEDRVYRHTQTKEVFVHYILSPGTVDEDMWHLIMQKWDAQRAVQEREAQFKSVEEILADAATANVKLAVARAMVERRAWKGKTGAAVTPVEDAPANRPVFGQVKAPKKAKTGQGLRPQPVTASVKAQQLSMVME